MNGERRTEACLQHSIACMLRFSLGIWIVESVSGRDFERSMSRGTVTLCLSKCEELVLKELTEDTVVCESVFQKYSPSLVR